MPTIVLVDDDRNLLNTIADALESEHYTVRRYDNSVAAWRALKELPADVAVLDIKMPGMDGLELLTRLRRDADLPVILLTSRDDELDEVTGLRMGADDYITKPVSPRLLVERIRALLRRRALAAEANAEPLIERGNLHLNPTRFECRWKDQKVALNVTEFLVLQSLVLDAGSIKTRRELMDAAYGPKMYVDDRTIDSQVKRLRTKFRAVDGDFAMVETLHGRGYRYRSAEL